MLPRNNERQLLWMGLGLIAGLCIAYVWPHEMAQAVSTDRVDDKFAICTVETQTQLFQPEAVFVLDFVTGRLTGALMNQQSYTFTNFWYRSIPTDFGLKNVKNAKYAIIPGNAYLTSQDGETMSTGCLYVAEMSSGKVVCYSFPIRNSKVPLPVANLTPVTFFSFRDQAEH